MDTSALVTVDQAERRHGVHVTSLRRRLHPVDSVPCTVAANLAPHIPFGLSSRVPANPAALPSDIECPQGQLMCKLRECVSIDSAKGKMRRVKKRCTPDISCGLRSVEIA